MQITALYAALLTVLFVALSVRVIDKRRRAGAALGDSGDTELLRRIRAQGNFVEYVSMGLILLGLAEGLRILGRILHLLGLTLLIGRVSYAYGVSRTYEQSVFRVIGILHADHVDRCRNHLHGDGASPSRLKHTSWSLRIPSSPDRRGVIGITQGRCAIYLRHLGQRLS